MRFLKSKQGAEISEVITAVGLIIAGGTAVLAALMGGLNNLVSNVTNFLGGLTFTNPAP